MLLPLVQDSSLRMVPHLLFLERKRKMLFREPCQEIQDWGKAPNRTPIAFKCSYNSAWHKTSTQNAQLLCVKSFLGAIIPSDPSGKHGHLQFIYNENGAQTPFLMMMRPSCAPRGLRPLDVYWRPNRVQGEVLSYSSRHRQSAQGEEQHTMTEKQQFKTMSCPCHTRNALLIRQHLFQEAFPDRHR